jgi:hypothetical protein
LLSEGNAAGSASAAAGSASAAAASYDDFDDRYLGPKTVNPTVDNDGDPLVAGALYFNTVVPEMRVWNGTAWQSASTVGGTVNSLTVNNSLTLSAGPLIVGEGPVVIGSAQSQAITGSSFTDLQVNGTDGKNGITIARWNAASPGPFFGFRKSRAATIGGSAIVANSDTLGELSFFGDDGTDTVIAATIRVLVDDTPGVGSMPGRLTFNTTPSGSSSTVERMRITSAGNVGIGTSSPTRIGGTTSTNNILSVNGSLTLPYSVSGAEPLRIGEFTNTNFTSGSSSTGIAAGLTISNWNVLGGGTGSTTIQAGTDSGNGGIVFQARQTNAGTVHRLADFRYNTLTLFTGDTERMRITSAGNVGIGTSSPIAKTQIAKTTDTALLITSEATNANTQCGHIDFQGSSSGVGQGARISAPSEATFGRKGLAFFTASAGSDTFTPEERMRITHTGNVGIGTSAPGRLLDCFTSIASTGFTTGAALSSGENAKLYQLQVNNTVSSNTAEAGILLAHATTDTAQWGISVNRTGGAVGSLIFRARTGSATSAERMRIDSAGNVGIGTSAPSRNLHVKTTVLATGTNPQFRLNSTDSDTTDADRAIFGLATAAAAFTSTSLAGDAILRGTSAGSLLMCTGIAERMRIDSSGNLMVGTTNTTPANSNVAGFKVAPSGQVQISQGLADVLVVNRIGNDGVIVSFRQDGTVEGTISVSGTTVSYNAFAGSHWSQLSDGSKPEILRGTVLESINELVEWPDEPRTERLPKCKISDTAGSKKVYGVFMGWDNDWTSTNDMYVTALGAFVCRVNADVVVELGDLLESNGDGTARVQSDDIIRSSTIGKVTSSVKTHEYDDGSYCVPTVLYCG